MSRIWTTPVNDQFADRLTNQVADGDAVRAEDGVLRAACGLFITPAPDGGACGRAVSGLFRCCCRSFPARAAVRDGRASGLWARPPVAAHAVRPVITPSPRGSGSGL
jgi:hypothetical protein